MAAKIRILAEWISKNGVCPETGEWRPDYDEYSSIECGSVDEAKRVSVERGRLAGLTEWAKVSMQRWDKKSMSWNDEETWSGDWSDNWDHETFDLELA